MEFAVAGLQKATCMKEIYVFGTHLPELSKQRCGSMRLSTEEQQRDDAGKQCGRISVKSCHQEAVCLQLSPNSIPSSRRIEEESLLLHSLQIGW